MADQILDTIRDAAEGQIDFEGQRFAELLATVSLCFAGFLSFVVGYFSQDIKLAMYVGLVVTGLTFVAVVPPWPFFKQHPVKWLPAGAGFDWDKKR